MNCFTVRRSETKSLIAPGISVSGNRIRIGINSSESMTSHVRFDKINPPVIDDNPKIISLASLKQVNPQRPYYVLERQSSTSFYNFAIVKVSTANIADTADLSYNGFISSIKGILAPIIVIRAKNYNYQLSKEFCI